MGQVQSSTMDGFILWESMAINLYPREENMGMGRASIRSRLEDEARALAMELLGDDRGRTAGC